MLPSPCDKGITGVEETHRALASRHPVASLRPGISFTACALAVNPAPLRHRFEAELIPRVHRGKRRRHADDGTRQARKPFGYERSAGPARRRPVGAVRWREICQAEAFALDARTGQNGLAFQRRC